MHSAETTGFDQLLFEYRQGNQEATQKLFALVYQDLRRLAQQYLNAERQGHTLQATALVHEAYLLLLGEGEVISRAARISSSLPRARCTVS